MAANILHLDDSNFEQEVLKSTVPVLVDFSATWCGPCKMLAPVVEKLADEVVGKAKVGKIDIDESPSVTAKFGISSVPTVIVFEGGQVKAKHVGNTRREKLIELLGV